MVLDEANRCISSCSTVRLGDSIDLAVDQRVDQIGTFDGLLQSFPASVLCSTCASGKFTLECSSRQSLQHMLSTEEMEVLE